MTLYMHVRILIVEKRKARALYQRTRLPSHKPKYSYRANSLKRTVSKIKALSIENDFKKLYTKDGSLW